MPTFHSLGVDFYYEVHGHGRPFVFSHGLVGNLERVKEFVLDLPGTSTILFDNRGHGRTAPLGDTDHLNFQQMAEDMAALLDHLGLEKAVIGGVSMGAGIALSFAVSHGERVLGLVLSRPAWLDKPNPPNLGYTPIVADLVEQYGLSAAVRLFEQTDYYRELEGLSPETAHSLGTLLVDVDADALAAAYRHIPASVPVDSFDRLRSIKAPVLVIGNNNDPIHPLAYAETLARALPAAEFRQIVSRFDDAAGHVREFRSALTDYLERLPVSAE